MQKINEVNAPIVGNKYLVPCYFNDGEQAINGYLPFQWIPILFSDSTHIDSELEIEIEHLHYDSRFIKDEDLYIKHGQCYTTALVQGFYDHWKWTELEKTNKILWLERICYRQEQLFPQPVFERLVTDKIKNGFPYTRMENMTCPHRSTCLKGHPVKEFHEGRYQGITCPAHGLSWDIETGFLIE
jgi:hypothetical protein